PGGADPALRRRGQGERGCARKDPLRRNGQAPRHRYRLLGRRPRAPAPRRLRLSPGLSDRALLAGLASPFDPRRHQPGDADDRRPRSYQAVTSEILTAVDQNVGRIRLNRPNAIHALTRDMCSTMIAALVEWRERPEVEAVTIDHAEGRGFCAGGDVVMLARSGAGDGAEARAFFHEEYRLNHLLFTYAKPTIAFMDGITMGGGVGISQPCRFRVATENTRFAMPETAIGLFP